MICRDNEDTIETALESAKGLFDEIIIVDTGSKDRTLEIVQRYTDKIARITWEDDFAKARNYGLDMATSDLIFWMDSDDELPEATRIGIRMIADDNNKNAAYMFKIHNIINDAVASKWLNDYFHLKLFPNRKDIRFHNTVLGKMHEGVVEDVMKLPIEIRTVDLSIIHHGYETSERLDSKIQRDIRICMNQPGYYYQFKIGSKFFIFNGYELSMWKIKSDNNETVRLSVKEMLFKAKEDMAYKETLDYVIDAAMKGIHKS